MDKLWSIYPFDSCSNELDGGWAETQVGLDVKRPLFLSDFSQNKKVLANFFETPKFQI
jgi:hypothetical protein